MGETVAHEGGLGSLIEYNQSIGLLGGPGETGGLVIVYGPLVDVFYGDRTAHDTAWMLFNVADSIDLRSVRVLAVLLSLELV